MQLPTEPLSGFTPEPLARGGGRFSLTFSIADQNFTQTKSIGILNLSVQLVSRLASRAEVSPLTVLSNSTLDAWLKLPGRIPVERHETAIAGRLRRILWDQWGAYAVARRLGHEWLFLPKGFASFVRPCPVRLAVCVADANHDYYRRHYPRSVPRLEAWYFRSALRGTLKHSQLIFTISDYTSAEVARLAREQRLLAPNIQTIGIGFDRPHAHETAKTDRVIALVSRWPHKRSDLAVQFLDRWQNEARFPGTIDWIGRLPNQVRLPAHPNWHHHLRVPEAEYRQRLAEARALVYFSEYEGFGMPPVEAAIAGTCPVYSELPATREVMAQAGCPFRNTSYESFAGAMQSALTVSEHELEQWASALLRRHSWDTVADRVVRAILNWNPSHTQ